MWIPPKVCDSFFDLYGGGRVYFGRAQQGPGLTPGTPPIMARIECEPYYPSGWFVVTRKKAMFTLNKAMKENMVDDQAFLPDWLVSDCYRGEAERLAEKIKKIKNALYDYDDYAATEDAIINIIEEA